MNLAIIKHVNFKFVTCLGYCLQRPEESSKTELGSTVFNPVQLKPQKQLITDELLKIHKVNWPHRNSSPLNEFKIGYLATMAFPTLFPYGEGDPTPSAAMHDVTLGNKIFD